MNKKILYFSQINLRGLHTSKNKPIKLFFKNGIGPSFSPGTSGVPGDSGYWDKKGNYGFSLYKSPIHSKFSGKMPILGKTINEHGIIKFYSFIEKEVQLWIDGAMAVNKMIRNFVEDYNG